MILRGRSVGVGAFIGRGLTWLQGRSRYRRVARSIVPAPVVTVADESDLSWIARRRGVPPSRIVAERTVFVARIANRIAGHGVLVRLPETHPHYPGYWNHDNFVWPLFRGLGVGEALKRRAIAQARSEGATALYAVVHPRNRRSLRLEQKVGSTVSGLEWQTLPDGTRRLVLKTDLREPRLP